MHAILKEYYRLLKPKGTLILISYGLPEKRLSHLNHPDFKWEVRIEKAIKLRQVTTEENEADGGPEPEYHYIYICVKVGIDKQAEYEAPVVVTEDPQADKKDDKTLKSIAPKSKKILK